MMQIFVQTILQTQASYRFIIQRKIRENNIDITFEMLHILRTLHAAGKVNQQELANLTFKDKSSLSYLMKSLEKRELIYRKEDETDKRSKLVALTSKGEKLYARIKILIDDVYKSLEKKININHIEECVKYMKEFNDTIKED